jgi:hypothetical protein
MSRQTAAEQSYAELMEAYFAAAAGSTGDKLANWPKFVSRQSIAVFLYKNALFERILNVHGSILEFGVWMGGGLFTWAQLSAVLEPVNFQRRIVGFDTFEGFPSVDDADLAGREPFELARVGSFAVDGIDADLERGIQLFDMNRPIGQIPKVELVPGDVTETLPRYLEENPHLVVSLLYLDLDLYQPTKCAIEMLWDRVPRGGVIAFDELNSPEWPGETQAVVETLGLGTLRLERVPFEPVRCFAVKD